MSVSKPIDPLCRAFQTAIDVLGRPWNGQILGALQAGPLRFSEVGKRAGGVGDKTLSARLKELEARGIIARRVEGGPPVQVLYALTPRGVAFRHVADAIERWGRELI
jgi:DNA-binding HxlR family transcriptional regulator